ncbi:single-stranded DNA-binding protein [Solobacterium sp.]|jgi:single-strand binding protein|uniref:single-stranded DNA-binding protein n=1 Tax=Solobacterium sp. TaxID=2060878 RepID=UPI001CB0A6E3|nr:single-stranded DNA-binding protein [Solobacterium sp.]MBF1072790.1 single-stranded DNA-binding protein [Solobacterium sp.]MBF1085523.1 single-stranded DNA-binding protein [Solobacterium sp.]MBF1095515.1 single-stranded DNA-binding protein [Solobacterium sp.]MBF1098605.1 single-stranded DNA-binding protein [Solobacterium sp.]MBF1102308.1 single-stranded DNA-binding protein [Solobacterium sp.]
MINRVVLVGRLTRDVEVRKTASGLSVATFTVACDRRMARGQDGNNQQSADFISCVAWRQAADFLGSYARKGALVGVEGRIQTRNYDRDGQKVYVTEIVCDTVNLLESKSQSQNRAQNSGYQDNSYQQPYSQPKPSTNDDFVSDDFGAGIGMDISSDDLPF